MCKHEYRRASDAFSSLETVRTPPHPTPPHPEPISACPTVGTVGLSWQSLAAAAELSHNVTSCQQSPARLPTTITTVTVLRVCVLRRSSRLGRSMRGDRCLARTCSCSRKSRCAKRTIPSLSLRSQRSRVCVPPLHAAAPCNAHTHAVTHARFHGRTSGAMRTVGVLGSGSPVLD